MRLIENPVRLPSAGWYDDPSGQPHERWWDGETWTDHINVFEPAPQLSLAPPLAYAPEVSFAPEVRFEPEVSFAPAVGFEPEALPTPAPFQSDPAFVYSSDFRAAERLTDASQVAIGSYSTDQLAATGHIGGASASGTTPDAQTYRPFGGHTVEHVALETGRFNPYGPTYLTADNANPSATTGLTLGIISVFVNPLLIVGFLGIRSSRLALKRSQFLQKTGYESVGLDRARWGIVLSILGTISGAIVLAASVVFVWGMLHAVPSFDKLPFEQSMIKSVHDTRGITLTKLDCPTSAPAVQGSTFQCVATKASGIEDVLYVRVVDNKGDVTWTLGL